VSTWQTWQLLAGIAAAVVAALLLGNYLLWSGRPDPASPTGFSQKGAAVFMGMQEPRLDADAMLRRLEDQTNPDFAVLQAVPLARVQTTDQGVDLAILKAEDERGEPLSCLATVEGELVGWACVPEPVTEMQVFWAETTGPSSSDDGGGLERSVTIFHAPEESVSMFVVLDSGVYVGAGVRGGASYVAWDGALGAVDHLVVVDGDGEIAQERPIG